MKKSTLALITLLTLTLVLVGCGQKGLEKISFEDAEKKLNNSQDESLAFIDKDGENFEAENEQLKNASQDHKIYYVELNDDITTSDYYQKEFTSKYPNEKDGIMKTNNGKTIKDKNVFSFTTDTDIEDKEVAEKDLMKFLNK